MASHDPKFSECTDCRHFSAKRQNPICRRCNIGEFFEELLQELNPQWDTSFRATRKRADHDDDE